jgi:hypothetical protein
MQHPSPPFETEWSLLLAACSVLPTEEKAARIRALSGSGVQWSSLLNLAENHGVQPILAQALLSAGGEIPAETLANLSQSYHTNVHKTLFLAREFVGIVDSLSQAGIEFMAYKGLALAQTLYGDVALRQSGDIDLLIHASDLNRVREAVADLGYIPHQTLSRDEEEAYLQAGYECVFDAPAGKNLLEVQWAIQPSFYSVTLDVEKLFRRAVDVTVAGAEIKTLSHEDSFLVLAVHAAKHVWGKLIWLCDLARISSMQALDWKSIAGQAQELGIVRILRVTLLLAQKLLGVSLPASAEANLAVDSTAGPLAKEVTSYIATEKTFDVESIAYFKLMLRLRERQIDRMRFLERLVFTPGPGEWAVVRLPKSLFPLYRVVRVTRLAARLVNMRV